ncbi:tetratricopeptide repeat-containing sensor histidine kinase [Mucilaginibacter sp. KACC 22063]|uniref:tetratricopeptide repeat-containing sensor histidine kinase n=1 Tax=Mucilaginibacter sp. KACC 22063 TaxID=3025666 RepID=UPI002365A308|nr:tetratricopeptide repeat-containing sensor histidine kinase [Mucilaginibacter sp. KACC 22063]WDF53619.1 tetratricopeptide repeat-containing sensor histidine kinase [Mucilaginibacter sp. KACC 22063]
MSFRYTKKYKIFTWPIAFACSLVFFWGCKQKEKDQLKLSAQYQAIFKQTLIIHDKYNPDSAQKYIDAAFREIKSPTLNERLNRLGFHYAVMFTTKKDFLKARIYADSILNLINKNGGQQKYPGFYANCRLSLGDAAFELKDYNTAYQNFFIGYQIGKNQLDRRVTSEFLYRMGMVTFKQGHYALAVKYFKESLGLIKSTNDTFVTFYRNQELMDNIGIAFFRLNKPDSAMAYYNHALHYITSNSYRFPEKADLTPVAQAVIYGNQADVYIKKKDYNSAIPLLKKSIAINSIKHHDNNDALVNMVKLADVYGRNNRTDSMKIELDTIKHKLSAISNGDVKANWYRLMSEYYSLNNKHAEAFDYLKKYNSLKDSLDENNRLLREANVTEQLTNFDKERQITLLKTNYRIQRTYLLLAVMFIIMSLVIAFLIYRNWQRSKHDFKVVKMLNHEINEQKASLQHTLDKLNDSSREKDRILHTVAHDLRNPLGGISALSNMMVNDTNCNDEQKEFIGIIKESADNSLELINELFEAADLVLDDTRKQLVDINTLVNNSIELLKFKAAEKNQHIVLSHNNTPLYLLINREKIWRVISNLIINAIKFSPAGTNIFVSIDESPVNATIAVKDNGIGIPDHMQTKVFNMFTEAKRPGTMGEKSFGLGLSISKQIVEAHNGKIWFENNPQGGTTFLISIDKPVA